MAIRREQPKRRMKKDVEVPSDADLFATPNPIAPQNPEPQYGDIFGSFMEMVDETQPSVFDSPPSDSSNWPKPDPSNSRFANRQSSNRRFSNVQIALLGAIIVVTGAVVYFLVQHFPFGPSQNKEFAPSQPISQYPRSPQPVVPAPDAIPVESQPEIPSPIPQRANLGLPNPEPLSLQIADTLYLQGDFVSALTTYDKLYRRVPPTEAQQPLRDFLILRMALCSKNSGNTRQADNMFRTVSLCRLPLLRALARYHQSMMLLDRERYIEAATKAYQTIALIEVVNYDDQWLEAVQQQCYFIVAEALTRNLLSLRDADADVPDELWSGHVDIDPFINLDEPQLKVFLASGSDKLDAALLSPQIRAEADQGRWSVICNGASVEELLSRFATNAKYDLNWAGSSKPTPEEEALRRRPIYLYLRSATAQQVMTVAAGSAGLLAQMDGTQNVKITDPASYTSLSDHTNRLADESISLWQRFLFNAKDDQRVPASHFTLGLLHAVRDHTNEAIAEFKLVANQFPKDPLAPFALLQSGRLKVTLRDYVGAQTDLKQLVGLYPDTAIADKASLSLADATMKAGLYKEATSMYRKVYNLGLSTESQTESSLGAGRCFYETGNYEEAARWLDRYVTLARNQNRREFHTACLLLGKANLALGRAEQAHSALNLALQGDLSRQQHIETIATLVEAYIEQDQLIDALNILENAHAWQLSQQEMIELLLLRARILRSIGLIDKAIALLEEKGPFLPSPDLKGKVSLELAQCYITKGDYEKARGALSGTFQLVEPGPLAHRIGCELARTCLRVNQPNRTISVCKQLLEYATTVPERQEIRELLSEAYCEQGQYNLAVAILLEDQIAASPSAAKTGQ